MTFDRILWCPSPLVPLSKFAYINAQWADYPGGHVFSLWRNALNFSVPMLFKTSKEDRKK